MVFTLALALHGVALADQPPEAWIHLRRRRRPGRGVRRRLHRQLVPERRRDVYGPQLGRGVAPGGLVGLVERRPSWWEKAWDAVFGCVVKPYPRHFTAYHANVADVVEAAVPVELLDAWAARQLDAGGFEARVQDLVQQELIRRNIADLVTIQVHVP
jgi:hypothetical protein